MADLPEWIQWDAINERLTIDGVIYNRGFFRTFARENIGTIGRFARRQDGVVEYEHIEPIDEQIFQQRANARARMELRSGQSGLLKLRNAEIWRLRQSGLTLRAIGSKFGITGSRVAAICEREKRREKWLAGHAARAVEITQGPTNG